MKAFLDGKDANSSSGTFPEGPVYETIWLIDVCIHKILSFHIIPKNIHT